MVSFDVVSLFPNVPPDLAADVASWCLSMDDNLPFRTTLNMQSIIALLHLCLNATYFCISGHFYQQTFSTVMGFPVSVTIANWHVAMEDWIGHIYSTCTFQPSPHFRKHYANNTCSALSKILYHHFTAILILPICIFSLQWRRRPTTKPHSKISLYHIIGMVPCLHQSTTIQHAPPST